MNRRIEALSQLLIASSLTLMVLSVAAVPTQMAWGDEPIPCSPAADDCPAGMVCVNGICKPSASPPCGVTGGGAGTCDTNCVGTFAPCGIKVCNTVPPGSPPGATCSCTCQQWNPFAPPPVACGCY